MSLLLREFSQNRFSVARRLDAAIDCRDASLGIKHKGRARDTHIGAAVVHLFDQNVASLAKFLLRVGEEGVWEREFLRELGVRLRRIRANSDDPGTLGVCVAKLARLDRSPRRIVLWVKEDDGGAAHQVSIGDSRSGLIRQIKVGKRMANFEHCQRIRASVPCSRHSYFKTAATPVYFLRMAMSSAVSFALVRMVFDAPRASRYLMNGGGALPRTAACRGVSPRWF